MKLLVPSFLGVVISVTEQEAEQAMQGNAGYIFICDLTIMKFKYINSVI